jgi:cyclophilin family peptidyl-prolyl cis-trans isomerase/uncharacterized protein (DUF2141 family)
MFYAQILRAVFGKNRARATHRRPRSNAPLSTNRRRLFASEQLEARWYLSADPIVTVNTNFGNFQIQLLPSAAPQSVANFLSYVDSGAYTNTIFHRSVPGFVEQAGGFTSTSDTFTTTSAISTIPTSAAIPLEYNLPNTLGTVAMARTSSLNSATDQWFVNLVDNTQTLGQSNGGGYAVFGNVLGNGMQVLNAIAQLQVSAKDSGTFAQLPLDANNKFARISSITVDNIDGTVFNDINGNGQLNSGETGISGRTVFVDVNGTGVSGGTNPTTTTDANGNYSFHGLTAGTYKVREVLPNGHTLTTALQTITVAADHTASSVNFGETSSTTGTISGEVFDDVNVNGQLDANETGLAGRTVFLDKDGTGVPGGNNISTTTDANGNYSFAGLTPGTYAVREVASAARGTALTTPLQSITVTAGHNNSGVNFGNVILSTIAPLPTPVGPSSTGTGDANSKYIDAVYQSILGRSADAASLTYWKGQLSGGTSRDTLSRTLWNSTEHRSAEIEQYYQTFLGRASDAAGKAFWLKTFSDPKTFDTLANEKLIIEGFLTSVEYSKTLHASDADFVTALYHDLDLRAPDAAGLSAWQAALTQGKTRLDVIKSFLSSTEANNQLVDGFYASFLHRSVDAAGQQAWDKSLQNDSASIEDVAVHILATDEYFARVTA